MNEEIIKRHNSIVKNNDIVWHLGDLTMESKSTAYSYLDRLNGNHHCIRGSHDYWMNKGYQGIVELKISKKFIVLCHYAMRVWPRSHYNSWQLYGHSHGGLQPSGKQLDVGVDTHDFYPWSFDEVENHMSRQPNNFNYIRNRK